ncbi:DUF5050 domain-containing protein [Clostridiaceae bacterium M8S5]|nr:DUF5050 domain-containing protein [Clostridiaceae bacterium M8S5]
MNKIKLFAVIFIFSSIFIINSYCTNSNKVNTNQEYNMSNIARGGYICSDKNLTYYNFSVESGEDYDTGMSKIHDKSNVKLTDNNVMYINVSDEWIYYINSSGDFETEKRSGTINKIKKDGANQTILSNDESKYLQLSDEWLYYINCEDDMIYKIKLDGTSKEKICNDKVRSMFIKGNTIYYSNKSDRDKVYKLDLANNKKEKLLDVSPIYFLVDNNYIYYLEYDYDVQTDIIYRDSLDGKTRKEVIASEKDLPRRFVIQDGYIYYNSWLNMNYNIIDSRNEVKSLLILKKKIGEQTYKEIGTGYIKGIDKNWIYFKSSSYVYEHLMRIKLDGTSEEIVK